MTRLAFLAPLPLLASTALSDSSALAEILTRVVDHRIEQARARVERRRRLRGAQEWLRAHEVELRAKLRVELDTDERRAWRLELLRGGFSPKWVATREINGGGV